jgi:hypothetical protein
MKEHDMHGFALTRGVFCLYIVLSVWTGARCEENPDSRVPAMAPTITVTGVDVRDNHFRLDYKVENGPKPDIWICDAMDSIQWGTPDFEVVPSKDGRTLTIRKRTGLSWELSREPTWARYVRLKAGKILNGSMVVPLPASRQAVVSSSVVKRSDSIRHIVLEIGYYKGELPGMIADARHGSEVVHFNEINEYRRSSNMEVCFYTDAADPLAESELLLQVAVDTPRMSYDEATPSRLCPLIDLRRCNRMEITYEPSALEYFCSYEDQRSGLKPAQMRRLQSLRKVVVDNAGDVKEFISQVSRGVFHGISVGPAKAHVVCYEGKDRVAILDVYRDGFLTDAGDPFSFRDAGYSGKFRRLIVRSIPKDGNNEDAAN